MANCCDFYMKIVGESDDAELLVKWFKSDYDLNNNTCESSHHFYNIREFNITGEEVQLNQTELLCEGFCDWSAGECMLDGKDSYYQKYLSVDTFGINLIKATRLLHLMVEVISIEPQANFTEHIIVDNGKLVLNEFKEIFSDEDYAKPATSDKWNDLYLNRVDSLIEFTI